ncbi:hypothetical protein [Bartonella sp. TT119HLJHH]|uniref:hypothetical protein n=1 Tax=Bartonella sp. TT119HLJHH TaxID=3243579 RepID=UPI0035D0BED3
MEADELLLVRGGMFLRKGGERALIGGVEGLGVLVVLHEYRGVWGRLFLKGDEMFM